MSSVCITLRTGRDNVNSKTQGSIESNGSRVDKGRVLVVDDEESVREVAEHMLARQGYAVTSAADGPEALRLVECHAPFDLFLVDVVMPRMQGDEFARQLRESNPNAKVLYFTGYVDKLFEHRDTLSENEAFIEKPATLNGLLEAISLMIVGKIEGLHGPR